MRKTAPESLASPTPSDMSNRSSTTARNRSASCPGGVITAVIDALYSSGSAQRTSRPHALTARRVASAWRACRANTCSRPSSRSMASASFSP